MNILIDYFLFVCFYVFGTLTHILNISKTFFIIEVQYVYYCTFTFYLHIYNFFAVARIQSRRAVVKKKKKERMLFIEEDCWKKVVVVFFCQNVKAGLEIVSFMLQHFCVTLCNTSAHQLKTVVFLCDVFDMHDHLSASFFYSGTISFSPHIIHTFRNLSLQGAPEVPIHSETTVIK